MLMFQIGIACVAVHNINDAYVTTYASFSQASEVMLIIPYCMILKGIVNVSYLTSHRNQK